MKKKVSIVLICFYLLCSCTKTKKSEAVELNKKGKISSNQRIEKKEIEKCLFDSIEMQTTEYNNIKFYSENELRGKGVITLFINGNVEIFNFDKTTYGSIVLTDNEEGLYDIKLPKIVIAREIIPDIEHNIFSFDAENPDTDSNFLIIYINKEKKLLRKKKNRYKFSTWDSYIKESFLHLTPKVVGSTSDERKYYYKTLKIQGDSMQIKSVSKMSCDYIEEYKDITKWIKWKEGSCKVIDFDFCY